MSSPAFSTELRPDPRLRALVLASGAGLGALGIVVLVTLPVAGCLRAILVFVWWAVTVRELSVQLAGYARVRVLRLDAGGQVQLGTRDRGWQPARLAAGSIVLGSLAWLRFRTADGQVAELLAGSCRRDEHWRRLQLIWRHLGAPPRSC